MYSLLTLDSEFLVISASSYVGSFAATSYAGGISLTLFSPITMIKKI